MLETRVLLHRMSFFAAAFVLLTSVAVRGSLLADAPKRPDKTEFAQRVQEILAKDTSFEKARLVHKGTIPILHLRGTPEERGRQYGTIFKNLLREIPAYMDTHVLRNPQQSQQARLLAAALTGFLPPSYRTELEAMAKASGIDLETLVILNTLADFFEMGCSTFTLDGTAASDRRFTFGRNLDYMSFDIAEKLGLVIVIHPEEPKRKKVAMITFAGLTGTYTGLNEDGLALGNMVSYNSREAPQFQGIPSGYLHRALLERCGTVDEAEAFLKKTRRLSNENLMVCDASGQAALFELGPTRFSVRKPSQGRLFATNHFITEAMSASPVSCDRFEHLSKRLKEKNATIGLEEAKKLLGDVALPQMNLHSMLILPAERSIHLAMGEIPAFRAPYQLLDAKDLFEEP